MNKLYALVENNEIRRINIQLPAVVGNTSIPAGSTGLSAHGLYEIVGQAPEYDAATQRVTGPTYSFDGTQVVRNFAVEAIPAEELLQALQQEIVQATQARLDDFARTRSYDGILSACTYATSSVPKFQAEGQYCVVARDETWATLYTILAEVEAGVYPMPTSFADIEPELPALVWP